ncbi:MAG: tetratricopeptide repeat protein [Fimbriiglobus sp.]
MSRKNTIRRRLRIGRFAFLTIGFIALCVGLFFLHKFQLSWQSGAIRDRAIAAAKAGDWPVSVSLYRNYLKFQPRDADAVAEFAAALEELIKDAPGKVTDLIGAYETLRRLDGLKEDQQRKLVKHYMSVANLAGAREHLQLLKDQNRENESDVEILELTAACDEREGKYPAAIQTLRQAIATNKASPESYLRLANILRRDTTNPNADQDAEKVLGELIRSKPNDPRARVLRAEYRARLGNEKAAKEDVEFAYRTIPGGSENLEVIQLMVAFANSAKDFSTAKDVLAKALEKMPKEARLQLSLADVQIQMRDANAAKQTLAKATQGDVPLGRTLLDMADRMVDLGMYEEVKAISARYLTGGAGFVDDYLQGRIQLASGNWSGAMPLLERAAQNGLKVYPLHLVTAFIGLADCHSLANNTQQRLRTLELALTIEPRSVRARMGQADCFLKLGKKPEAMSIYQQLMLNVPSARVAYCEAKLADIVSRPEAERNWLSLDDAFGPEPHSVQLSVIRANSMIQRNKVKEAIEILEKTVTDPESTYLTGPRVALAYAKGSQNPAAGFAVLDAAERALGDKVDFRIARAGLLLRINPIELKSILALSEKTGSFTSSERYQLHSKLGNILASLRLRKEALVEYQKASAENPYDIALRMAEFEIALADNNDALQLKIIDDLRKIEGSSGPLTTVAEVTRELKTIKPEETERIENLRTRLLEAQKRRTNWGPLEVLLADLDYLSGKNDSALGHYRTALELGEDSEGVIRNTVRLLMERQGQIEALEILNRASRRGNLSEDLLKQLVVLQSALGENKAASMNWAKSEEASRSANYRDHLMRAGVFEAGGDKIEARKAAEKALSLNEQAPENWVSVVRLYLAEGKTSEAKAVFERATTTLKPANTQPVTVAANALALGVCAETLGDVSKAEKYLREAHAALPEDVAVSRQLHRFLARTSRGGEANDVYQKLVDNPKARPESKRWARRMLAFNRVSGSGAQAEMVAGLELIDTNLKEGNNLVEDQRARALILATDPFRQVEAIQILTDSAKTFPLSNDENYYLGRMYLQQSQYDKAEAALREATRITAAAPPEHLAMLSRVQILRGNSLAATDTVAKLKSAYANSWEAISEEARLLAFNANKSGATKLLVESPIASLSGEKLRRIAPFLEELSLPEAAEKIYAEAATADSATAFLPLASFYMRSGRSKEVIDLAFQNEAKVPVGITARLLSGAVRSKPVDLVPDADRLKWIDVVRSVDAWIAKKLPQNSSNAEVLFAKAELDDMFQRYGDEIATYEQLVQIAPDNDVYGNNFAMILALANRDGGEKPLNAINRVITRRGPKASFLDTRAIVHIAAEKYDEAIKDLNAAISLDPKPGFYFHLAMAEDRKSPDKPTRTRDQSLREAIRLGLKKSQLHQKEWPDYDRLVAPLIQK